MQSTILIVDDEQGDVLLFRRVLERAGFHVFTSTDPHEALDLLDDHPVDLLLSDVWMPTMDGFHLIARAKAAHPEIATLMMTGYGSIETAIKALHRGVDGLILKQVDNADELVQAVERTLIESRERREVARSLALRPLFDVTEQLLAETSPEKLEGLIVDVIRSTFRAIFAAMYCRNPKTGRLEQVHSAGASLPAEEVDAIAVLAEQTCAWGAAAVLLPQVNLEQIGWQACLAAPVQRRDDYVLFAGRAKGSEYFSEADLDMFVILCRQAVMVLEHAKLYDERKAHLKRLEESQRALVQTEKMAAVGRLIASLAHEINNPLQAVRNGLHLSMRDDIEPEKRDQYLSMTKREVDRLVETVHRMLDFSRPSRTDKHPVRLNKILDTVMSLLQPQLRHQDIHVKISYDGDEPVVCAISDQIEQVVLNLMINAMDSLEEKFGGGACQEPDAKQIWINVQTEQDTVRVLVEDSGCGVQVELGDQVFEPFVSTKRQGTGLGLSVSYEIIERHGGALAIVPSTYATGACFAITLPRYTDTGNHFREQHGNNIDC